MWLVILRARYPALPRFFDSGLRRPPPLSILVVFVLLSADGAAGRGLQPRVRLRRRARHMNGVLVAVPPGNHALLLLAEAPIMPGELLRHLLVLLHRHGLEALQRLLLRRGCGLVVDAVPILCWLDLLTAPEVVHLGQGDREAAVLLLARGGSISVG